jgi:hypothetical protein
MGVFISEVNFDTIDIMKDLECARQALDKNKIKKCPKPCEEITLSDGDMVNDEVPLLEWVDNDSEAEQFTRSKKKKKEVVPSWKIQLGGYRLGVRELLLHCTGVKVDRKILSPNNLLKSNLKVHDVERLILEYQGMRKKGICPFVRDFL